MNKKQRMWGKKKSEGKRMKRERGRREEESVARGKQGGKEKKAKKRIKRKRGIKEGREKY